MSSNTFDADAFALRKLKFNGTEYSFRPATIRDQIEYLPSMAKRLGESKDENERFAVMMEVVRKYIPEITEDELSNTTMSQLVRIYYFAVNGILPEEEKNF